MFLLLALIEGAICAQVCGTSLLSSPPPSPSPLSTVRRHSWPDTACRPTATYTIPIVFHVIYSGETDSLSYDRIMDQVHRLFEDYRRLPGGGGFTPKGVDMDIEFSLATRDPQGQPTTGVVYWRYDQPPLNWSSPGLCVQDEYAMKAATGWPRDKYLNIWVVPAICGFSGNCADCSGIAGYAYYPDIGPTVIYGSVVGAPFIGGSLSGRGGRTLVHELGHNLGLAHPFEGGCGTTDCTTSGDEVCDTPPTAQENFRVQRQNTCDNDSPDLPDDPRNYMDYVDDASMSHFTSGQKSRAESFLLYPPSSLWPLYQPSNLQLTGAGPYGHVKAAFWSESQRVLPGTPVRFHAVAAGQPHLYEWDFGGGIADDPHSPCPRVRFPSPGAYTVRLIVENLSGRKDTFVRQNFIQVDDSIWHLPLREGWEGALFPPSGFSIENLDAGQGGSRTWERWGSTTPPRGGYGLSAYSVRLPFFSYSRYGERDYLLSPALDFEVDSSYDIQLRFALSYACLDWGSDYSYPLEYTDTLRVWLSPDGGGQWELIYEKGGRALSTRPEGCPQYRGSLSRAVHFPDSTSWRTDTVSLQRYRGIRGARIRFEGVCGWGNLLYLDDIIIDTVRRVNTHQPSYLSGSFQLGEEENHPVIQLTHAQHLTWVLYDVMGRRVLQEEKAFPPGKHTLSLPPLGMGMYFLRVSSAAGETLTLRLLRIQ
ncbi:MAG: M43 family zinc metalloprotease [Bacteroidia bacterium]|nr:M43 family zinc metalloprotease [Bacteroidia bacterium]